MGHTKPPEQLSGHWFTTCIALLLANSNRAHKTPCAAIMLQQLIAKSRSKVFSFQIRNGSRKSRQCENDDMTENTGSSI